MKTILLAMRAVAAALLHNLGLARVAQSIDPLSSHPCAAVAPGRNCIGCLPCSAPMRAVFTPGHA